jgi:C4-dicarboxylate-binding protein DctP
LTVWSDPLVSILKPSLKKPPTGTARADAVGALCCLHEAAACCSHVEKVCVAEKLWTSLFKALGSSPTSINFNEVYSALQTKIVDGQENAASTVWDGKLYEVQKFMSVNEHIFGMHLIVINDRIFSSLSEDNKQILVDGARMHTEVANSRKAMDNLQGIEKIRQAGVRVYVNSPSEKEAFRKTSQPAVIEFIASQTNKELIDRLLVAVEDTKKRVYNF